MSMATEAPMLCWNQMPISLLPCYVDRKSPMVSLRSKGAFR
jgi:hypothetical protein